MAIALIEIMKLAEKLSADEQLELAAKLIEQVRKSSAVVSPPRQHEIPVYPATNPVNQLVEDEREDESLEDPGPFSPRHIPPEDFFVAQRRFVDAAKKNLLASTSARYLMTMIRIQRTEKESIEPGIVFACRICFTISTNPKYIAE